MARCGRTRGTSSRSSAPAAPARWAASCAPTLRARGIRFESVDGDDTWHVDPVPRVIPADEWEPLAAGLGQRVRALNAFVADVYGERRIVAEGVMPARVLDTAEGFEPAMCGVAPPDGVWTAVGGLDIVRDSQGRWMVLEDNVRTPSGIGYWIAAREATLELLRPERAPHPIEAAAMALRNALGPGNAVVLTDGQENAAYWEHAFLAERMDVPLVVPADLEVRDGPAPPRRHARGRRVPPDQRRRGGQHGGRDAPAGRSGRRGEAGELPRHGRGRRQAGPRLCPRHDPLLPRRDAAAGAGGDVRPRRARRRSSARSTCSTSS